MKKILFFILLIFLISKISAGTLVISPEEVNIEGNQGEKICKNVSLSGKGNIIIKDKWAQKWQENKELNLHKLTQKELNVELIYPEKISIYDRERIEICFFSKEFGRYHGVLLFREENSNGGIGIWLNVSVKRTEFLTIITGAFVEDNNTQLSLEKIISLFTFILLIGLIFLVVLLKKKHKNTKV